MILFRLGEGESNKVTIYDKEKEILYKRILYKSK
jgi:hypothetical protein